MTDKPKSRQIPLTVYRMLADLEAAWPDDIGADPDPSATARAAVLVSAFRRAMIEKARGL